MLCPKCSNDKFRTVDVFRERRFEIGKGWIYDPDVDTRRIMCRQCGSTYLVESQIKYKEVIENKHLRAMILPIWENI